MAGSVSVLVLCSSAPSGSVDGRGGFPLPAGPRSSFSTSRLSGRSSWVIGAPAYKGERGASPVDQPGTSLSLECPAPASSATAVPTLSGDAQYGRAGAARAAQVPRSSDQEREQRLGGYPLPAWIPEFTRGFGLTPHGTAKFGAQRSSVERREGEVIAMEGAMAQLNPFRTPLGPWNTRGFIVLGEVFRGGQKERPSPCASDRRPLPSR